MKNQPSLAIKKIKPQRSELNTLIEHFQNKQYDEAERLALTLTDKFKTHPFGWKVLGAVFNKTGRLSEGLIACQKSVELDPKNAENHNNLANIFHKLDRLKEAEKSYKKVVELTPENAEIYNSLGNIFNKSGRSNEASTNANYRGVGLSEMIDAIENNKINRCNGELALHVLDIIDSTINAAIEGEEKDLRSTCIKPNIFSEEEIKILMKERKNSK